VHGPITSLLIFDLASFAALLIIAARCSLKMGGACGTFGATAA
jgi:hypothetical protein